MSTKKPVDVSTDETEEPTPPVEPVISAEDPKDPESEEKVEEEEEESEHPDSELPDWAQKKMTKANKEAERYRIQLRDLQTKLEGAKTPEEVAAITGELTTGNKTLELELAKERALRKYELEEADLVLMEDVADPAKIDAFAKRLSERFGSAVPENLRGGLDPTDDDEDSNDPGELAKKYGRRRL